MDNSPAQSMWLRDTASQAMGMTIEDTGLGTATLSMTVRDDMLNGHGICHGCYIFAVADSTFAIACNSYGPTTVAADCQVSFLRPAKLGEKLTATAIETYKRGRNGIYDITVTGDDGETVAVFRGKSRTLADTQRKDAT